jgi:hypothetical protein
MADEFNFNGNTGQINVAKDNAKINAEQNRGSKYNISGGISGAIGDGATGTVNVNNSEQQNSEIEKIKDLIKELMEKIPRDTTIDDKDKEKMQKAINTTNKQIENNDKDTLEACVNNLENVNNGISKGTEIFKKIVSLVGLIRAAFGI